MNIIWDMAVGILILLILILIVNTSTLVVSGDNILLQLDMLAKAIILLPYEFIWSLLPYVLGVYLAPLANAPLFPYVFSIVLWLIVGGLLGALAGVTARKLRKLR